MTDDDDTRASIRARRACRSTRAPRRRRAGGADRAPAAAHVRRLRRRPLRLERPAAAGPRPRRAPRPAPVPATGARREYAHRRRPHAVRAGRRLRGLARSGEEWLEPDDAARPRDHRAAARAAPGPRRRRLSAGAVLARHADRLLLRRAARRRPSRRRSRRGPTARAQRPARAAQADDRAERRPPRFDRPAPRPERRARPRRAARTTPSPRSSRPGQAAWPRTITREEAAAALHHRRLDGPGLRLVAREPRRGRPA